MSFYWKNSISTKTLLCNEMHKLVCAVGIQHSHFSDNIERILFQAYRNHNYLTFVSSDILTKK